MRTISCRQAELLRRWLLDKRGVAYWTSVNLSNPGAGWYTPARQEHSAEPMGKPTWQAANTPEGIFESMDDFLVQPDREVMRFHIAVRRAQFSLKLTDASTGRVERALAKAGDGSYYKFDYEMQEAVIMAPHGEPVILSQWKGYNT